MSYKHCCVVDQAGYYDLVENPVVLVLTEPYPTGSGFLDIGGIGSALVASCPLESIGDVWITADSEKAAAAQALNAADIYVGVSSDETKLFLYAHNTSDQGYIAIRTPDQECTVFVGDIIKTEQGYALLDADRQLNFTFSQELESVQHYALREGERLIDTSPPIARPFVGAEGFICPRWDGEQWTEGATAGEIADWEAAHPAPLSSTTDPDPRDLAIAQLMREVATLKGGDTGV